MGVKSFFIVQEAPANALSLNKDFSQVVIAGRNVFKVLHIEEDRFVERLNLRIGKSLNLSFSSNDVVWNPFDETQLATAATNGQVVLWDLNKASRNKQDHVFSEHKRTCNKVTFHPSEPHVLVSGSQDGTMKLFDVRKRDVAVTFQGNTESVRDLQFNPSQPNTLAAVSENGQVQLWDKARADRCVRSLTAHNGPAYACDWHPSRAGWLATAGRDKAIKIWDTVNGTIRLVGTIPTMASVGRVVWRPQREHHIASAALLVDCSINVWDKQRPFIPFAAFSEHTDVTTGIAWKGDPRVFLSTSKDSTLYLHRFEDAERPADRANPHGLCLSADGDLGIAVRQTPEAGGRPPRRPLSSSDLFRLRRSVLSTVRAPTEPAPVSDWLQESARRYLLHGRAVADMCEHNAAVATSLRRYQVARTWRVVKLLYTSSREQPAGRATWEERPAGADGGAADPEPKASRNVSGGGGETKAEDAETDCDEPEPEQNLATIASGLANAQGDFFFGDGEVNEMCLDYDDLDVAPDYTLPTEAFEPRHELADGSPPPESLQVGAETAAIEPAAAAAAAAARLPANPAAVEQLNLSLLAIPASLVADWPVGSVVADMLQHYAVDGDVQTAVSVMVVLGDRLRPHLQSAAAEHWCMAYLELLARFQLWNVATEVVRLSPIPTVSCLNQMVLKLQCGRCGAALERTGWWCHKCHAPSTCALCHRVVRGLQVWCQGCAHGGHLSHMRQWFSSNRMCPSGCGHKCVPVK
ncbi:GATOR complex protein WDR24-like [Amphibalanus amphitrite]|uniref:GATOR complex protein WDR24-like n=1 Tax=Amphibalanus amphitrite TaxID=1232801 RepID=UPI001C926902|nr:GATOR complex protein WDR24-like [Amphibalanus amphitrite]XP_043226225.1 GATOR complex protein WDR24-like [Amphibalanus amphitrite]